MSKNYIHRKLESKLMAATKQFPAIVLTGPRQSGKSTLLRELFPHYHYVTFDDPIMREQAINDPNLFLDHSSGNLIIDEIQYVPELLSYIKIRIDNDRQQKGRFLLTGSQQFGLIKNLGDTLAGRIGILELLPFSTLEKLKSQGMNKLSQQDLFIHACLTGSFPELTVHKNMDSTTWYASYVQTYLERDIRSIYDIGNLRDFQQFMKLLAARCSQFLNLSDLSGEIGVSTNTVKRWISILEASRIIYLLPPYYRNFGKRITKSPKVYFLDCGLVTYLTGLKTKEHLLTGPMAGALFENYCIQETIKTFLNRGEQPPVYHLRTSNQLEVDLLIETAYSQVRPIEIKMSQTPKSAMAQPIEKLISLFTKLKFHDGCVISLSEKNMPISKNVVVKPLGDYWAEI